MAKRLSVRGGWIHLKYDVCHECLKMIHLVDKSARKYGK